MKYFKGSKNKRWKSGGFSLGEVLIVVAIIGVLSALSFVAVASYQRDLKGLDMDATAREIYMAAQNHMSMADGQNFQTLPDGAYGTNDTFFNKGNYTSDGEEVDNIFYFVIGENDRGISNTILPGTALSLMLPENSIEATVRDSGSYIIRYQKDPAQILDVFFCEPNGKYPHEFLTNDGGTEFQNLMNNYRASASARRTYGDNKAVIGYYGSYGSDSAKAYHNNNEDNKTLKAPSITVENGDKLVAKVKSNNAINDGALTLVVRSKSTPANYFEIPLIIQSGLNNSKAATEVSGSSFQEIIKYDGTSTFTVTLDDITAPGANFAEIFKQTATKNALIPGEDIEIYAYAKNNFSYANIATSAISTTNSLFASVTYTKVGGNSVGNAEITSIRHLENLDPDLSKLNSGLNIVGATQTGDLSWTGSVFNDDTAVYVNGYTNGVAYSTADGYYHPVTPDTSKGFSYDGGNFKISGLNISDRTSEGKRVLQNAAPSSAKGYWISNAGLFGSICSTTHNVEIKDIELIDFTVVGQYAGALAGYVDNTTVKGILVHNTGTSANEQNIVGSLANTTTIFGSSFESSHTLDQTQTIAGGLIACANDLEVKSCASAVYVTSQKYAGGLVGYTDGGVYEDCYVGGHTYNAEYQKSPDSLGHYNVSAYGTGSSTCYFGGFIAILKNSTVNYCYSTASVYGTSVTNVGGFIGGDMTANNKVSNSYSTGNVFADKAGTNINAFVGVKNGTYSNCYFLSGISEHEQSTSISGVTPLTVSEKNDQHWFFRGTKEENPCASALPYDKALVAHHVGNYSYPTIAQLHQKFGTALTNAPEFLTVHIGDWQLPDISPLPITIKNDDELTVEAKYKGNIKDITLGVYGTNSKKAVLYQFKIDGDDVTISAVGDVDTKGKTTWRTSIQDRYNRDIPMNKGTDAAGFAKKTDDGIVFTLDSITKAGLHFIELFSKPGDAAALTIGENIKVYVVSGEAEWKDIDGITIWDETEGKNVDAGKFTNSLFAYDDTVSDNTAVISEIRHLQNLDSAISGVSNKINVAELDNSINADGAFASDGFYSTIYSKGADSKHLSGSFYGIRNTYLTLFEGNYYTISNLIVNSGATGYVGISDSTPYDAGLFRATQQNLTIRQLRMYNCKIDNTAKPDSGSVLGAGSFVGCAYKGSVTLNTVLAAGKDAYVHSVVYCGGLVGQGHTTTLSITNSAASVDINGQSYTGGLIGRLNQSDATITRSYVGGRTSNKMYEVDSADKYNIYAKDSYAGGIIGHASASTIDVSYSFSAASVAASNYSGGIIGYTSDTSTASFTNVYCIAPVYRVKNPNKSSYKAGTFMGSSGSVTQIENCYYLATVYEENFQTKNGNRVYRSPFITYDVARGSISNNITPVLYNYESGISPDRSTTCSKTYAYDDGLSTLRYPFTVWTSLPFKYTAGIDKSTASNGSRYYYGDWEPIIDENGEDINEEENGISTVTFYVVYPPGTIIDPNTGSANTEPIVREADDEILKSQNVLASLGGEVILPEAPDFGGYQPKGWYYDQGGSDDNRIIGPDESGSLPTTTNIPGSADRPQSAQGDFNVYLVYEAANTVSVNFFYVDPTDGNSINQLGSERIIEKGGSITPPVKSFSGYRLVGWYTTPHPSESDMPIDFSSVNESIIAYAVYAPNVASQIIVHYRYVIVGSEDDQRAINGLNDQIFEYTYDPDNVYTTEYELPDLSHFQSTGSEVNQLNLKVVYIGTDQNQEYTDAIKTSGDKKYLKINENVSKEYTVVYEAEQLLNNYTIRITYKNTANDTFAYSDNTDYVVLKAAFGSVGRKPAVANELDYMEGFEILPFTSDVIGIDGKTIIDVTYERLEYTIVYDLTAGFNIPADTLLYGQPITETLNNATTKAQDLRSGEGNSYTVSAWKLTKNDGTNAVYSDITMPACPLKASATWSGTAGYKIFYWKQLADVPNENDAFNVDTCYALAGSESGSGKIGDTVPTDGISISILGSEKDHFHMSEVNQIQETIIRQDDTTVLNVYFDRNIYHIYFIKDSSVNKTTRYIKVGSGSLNVDSTTVLTRRSTGSMSHSNSNGYYYESKYDYCYDGTNFYKSNGQSFSEGWWMFSTTYYKYDIVTNLDQSLKNQMISTGKGFYNASTTSQAYGTIKAEYYYDGSKFYSFSSSGVINGKDVYFYDQITNNNTINDLRSKITSAGYYNTENVINNLYTTGTCNDFTITARYDQDIHDQWPDKRDPQNGKTMWYVSSNNDQYSANTSRRQGFISVMPGKDTYFFSSSNSGRSTRYVNSYLQELGTGNYVKSDTYSYSFAHSGSSSTWEDYPRVPGFTIQAYDASDATSFNTNYGEGTAEIYTNSSYRSTEIGSSSNTQNIYYKRNLYDITYVEDSTANAKKTTYSSMHGSKIEYEASLNTDACKYANYSSSKYPVGEYTFAGWYDNSSCAGAPFDFSTATMPVGGLELYAKWDPITYVVTFDLNNPASGDTPVMTGASTVEIFRNSSVLSKSEIYDNSTGWTAAYTPSFADESVDYVFKDWCYKDGSGNLLTYNPATPITGNITLYAKWMHKTATVTIKHVYVDPADTSHIITVANDSVAYARVGETITVTLNAGPDAAVTTVKGNMGTDTSASSAYTSSTISYYPLKVSDTMPIEDDSPTVTFYYNVYNSENWSYTVSYYLKFEDIDGVNEPLVYKLSTSAPIEINAASKMISFEMPAGYESYYNTGDDTFIVNPRSTDAKFYLAPETYDLMLNGGSAIYNGQAQELAYTTYAGNNFVTTDMASETTPASIKMPAGYSTAISYSYETEPKNSGSHNVTAKLTVSDGTNAVTIWNSDTERVSIRRRTVVLKSLSYGWTYDGKSHSFANGTGADTHPSIINGTETVVLNDIDGPAVIVDTTSAKNEGFVGDESYTFTFDSTAFKINAGTVSNTFTFTLTNGGDINNYTIHRVYGILKVTGSAEEDPEQPMEGSYVIVFHDGYTEGASEITQVAEFGQAATLLTNTFSREGYAFEGWLFDPADTTAAYYDGDSILINSLDGESHQLDLYAKWTPNPYTISFNKNNGSGSMMSILANYGEEITLPANTFTRTGYSFTGWNTKSNGTGTAYTDEAVVNNLTTVYGQTITLYAQWKADEHTITFVSNGGDAVDPIVADFETEVTAPAVPSKVGYNFAGWYEDPEFGGDSYEFTTMPASDITLYAKWNAKQYWLHFNKNAVSATGTMVDQQFSYDVPQALSEMAFTNTGYYFLGWNTLEDGSGIRFDGDTGNYVNKETVSNLTANELTPEEALQLYAQWDVVTYTVAFNGNGATDGDMDEQTHTYIFEDDATDPGVALTRNAYTRDGYIFQLWNTVIEPTTENPGVEYADEALIKNLTDVNAAEITMYAQWKANEYKVIFNGNGATSKTGSSDTAPYEQTGFVYNDEYDLQYELEEALTAHGKTLSSNLFAKTGYSFNGWNTAAEGTDTLINGDLNESGNFINNARTINLTTGDTANLYAQWKADTYTINLDAKEGTGSPASVTVTYDGGLSETVTAPTRTGYSFDGWAETDGGTDYVITKEGTLASSSYVSEGKWTTVLTDPLKLYAHWSAGQYTVNFNVNGGNALSEGDASKTVTYGQAYGTLPTPTRTGYTFDGWFTAQNGGSQVQAFDTYTLTTGQTLWAHWTIKTYTITYHGLDGTSISGTNPTTYTVEDADITLINPTMAGHSFIGWTGTDYDSASTEVIIAHGSTGNREYTAHLTANTYTITLNVNGATNCSNTTVTVTYGSSTLTNGTVPASPFKPGNTFVNWTTVKDSDNTVVIGADGKLVAGVDGYTDAEGNWIREDGATLYVKWNRKNYTITFKLNGGSGTDDSQATIKYTTNVLLSGSVPSTSKTGYTLQGWSTTDGGTTYLFSKTGAINANVTDYTDSESKWIRADDATVFAKWTPNTYTVTYNGNSGTPTATSKEVTYDASYGTLATANRNGYEFNNWWTSASGGTQVTADTIVKTAADHSIYAHWTAKDQNVVYAKYNNGADPVSTTDTAKTDQKIKIYPAGGSYNNSTANQDVTVPYNGVTIGTPERTNYTFKGWTKGSESGYAFTLTANWKINAITVSYELNYSGASPSTYTTKQIVIGSNYELPTDDPTRNGYRFDGWYTATSGGNKITSSTQMTATSNHSVYAHWTKLYTITYHANGGSGADIVRYVASGESHTTIANTFAKSGARFIGWSTTASYTSETKYYPANYNMGSITKDTDLYAVWLSGKIGVARRVVGGNKTYVSYDLATKTKSSRTSGSPLNSMNTGHYGYAEQTLAPAFNGKNEQGWSMSGKGHTALYGSTSASSMSKNGSYYSMYLEQYDGSYTLAFGKYDSSNYLYTVTCTYTDDLGTVTFNETIPTIAAANSNQLQLSGFDPADEEDELILLGEMDEMSQTEWPELVHETKVDERTSLLAMAENASLLVKPEDATLTGEQTEIVQAEEQIEITPAEEIAEEQTEVIITEETDELAEIAIPEESKETAEVILMTETEETTPAENAEEMIQDEEPAEEAQPVSEDEEVPASGEEQSEEFGCIAAGTLITLADGTQKTVEKLNDEDMLLVWNFNTGTYDEAPIYAISSTEVFDETIMHAKFSDGTDVRIFSEHGFFDIDQGEYVYINEENSKDLIGHNFVKYAEDGTWTTVTLKKVTEKQMTTTVYNLVTEGSFCYYANGMLSMPGSLSGLFNIYKVNTETMMYDAEAMQADIAKYGKLEYKDVMDIMTEEMFEAFGGANLKIAMEKELIIREDIQHIAERFTPIIQLMKPGN